MLTKQLTACTLAFLTGLCLAEASHGKTACRPGSTAPHCHGGAVHHTHRHDQEQAKPEIVARTPALPVKPVAPAKPTDPTTLDGNNPIKDPAATNLPTKAHGALTAGNPQMKLPYRATTTLYFDTTGGACGCFNTNNKAGYSQQWGIKLGNGETVHMAAGSHSVFNYGSGDGGWCGAACGKCFRLTTTDPKTCPRCGLGAQKAGITKTVAVYDLCPPSYAKPYHFCAPSGITNEQGYNYHFDIHSNSKFLDGQQWDNPVVDFEEVECAKEVKDFFKDNCCQPN